MCIDFRNLNNCTEDTSHPIPHIGEMLRRIGAHGAKVFAVVHPISLPPGGLKFPAKWILGQNSSTAWSLNRSVSLSEV